MDSNRNLLLPFGNRRKQSTGIALAALLIFGAVAAVTAYTPQKAYAAVSITTSSDSFFGNDYVRVLITDTSLTGGTGTDQITPTVEAKGATDNPQVNEIGTSGTFEFFITTRSATTAANSATASPTNPTTDMDTSIAGKQPIMVRIHSGATDIAAGAQAGISPTTTSISYGIAATLASGDTVKITYGGTSKELSFGTSSASLSADRTVAGTGNEIIVKLNDPDAGNDPTVADVITMSTTDFEALVAGTNRITFGAATISLTEDAPASNVFEATVTVLGTTGDRLTGFTLPQGVTFRLSDLDVYTHTTPADTGASGAFVPPVPTSGAPKVTTSVTLQNTDGVISLAKTPATTASGLQIQINDQDRNIKSGTKDSLSAVSAFLVNLGGTQANTPSTATATAGTAPFTISTTVTGITVTTSGAVSGTITITQTAAMGTSTTLSAGTPTQTGTVGTGLTLGTLSASTGTGATTAASSHTVTITVPFSTTGAVSGASIGTLTTVLTAGASTTVALSTGSGSPTLAPIAGVGASGLVLGGTQTNTVTPGTSAASHTLDVSGLTVTTTGPLTAVVTVNQVVTLGPAQTASVSTPTSNVAPGAGVTIGTMSASVSPGTSATTQTVTFTIPISTTGAVSGVSLGTIRTTLTLGAAATASAATGTGASASPIATTGGVTVTVAGVAGAVTGVTFEETDKNTGLFKPTTTDQKIPILFGTANSITGTSITLDVATIEGDPDISIVYVDPAASPTGAKVFTLITKLSHVAGTLAPVQAKVGVTDSFALTLTDADLNTDDKTIETYVVTFPVGTASSTAVTIPTGASATTAVGTFTAKAAGAAFTPTAGSGALILTFIETTASSGVFTASNIGMNIINTVATGGLKDGDKVEFEYTDRMESPDSTSTATITVGKPSKTITVDRTTVPLPATAAGGDPTIGAAKFTVTITDPTRNTNTGSTDTFTFASQGSTSSPPTFIEVTNGAGTVVATGVTGSATTADATINGLENSITFTETGLSTGVFTATISLTPQTGGSALSTSALNGAKVKFSYDGETTSITLKSSDGVLTTDKGSVTNGDTVVVTVSDADLNRDPAAKESATFTFETKSDRIEAGTGTTAMTMDETGLNTGIFTKTVVIGTDIRVSSLTANTFASSIDLDYVDAVATDNSRTVRELTVKVATNTGTITATPAEVGPGSKITIIVNDKDLNANPAGTDTITSSGTIEYLKITSDRSGVVTFPSEAGETIAGEETGANTGQFKTTLTLTEFRTGTDTGSTAFAGTGTSPTGKVSPGDTIQIRYTDQKNAAGSKAIASAIVKVVSKDPEMKASTTTVGTDGSFTATISDVDRNRDGDAPDTFKARVTSTSDPVGLEVTFLETGANTATFTGTITTSSSVTAGAITVKSGDTVTVKYNDAYPGDYATRKTQVSDPSKDFFLTVQVGAPRAEPSPTSTTPSPAEPTRGGVPITEVSVGEQILLGTTVVNNEATPMPVTVMIRVDDPDGVTVRLAVLQTTVAANGEVKLSGDFKPDAAGEYTVKVFVVTDLADPQSLATPSTTTLTVS